jgi:hypothetical protein
VGRARPRNALCGRRSHCARILASPCAWGRGALANRHGAGTEALTLRTAGERAAFTLLLWCTHVCFYWGYNLFIALVIHSGLIESRRIIKDKEPDRELFFRSLKHQLINHALQPLAVYYIVYPGERRRARALAATRS